MITEQQLKEIEDRISLPPSILTGRELQLVTDIKLLIQEVRSREQPQIRQTPPYQTGS